MTGRSNVHKVGPTLTGVDLETMTRSRLQVLSQRATPARLRLVAAIAAAGRPVTITEVLEREPSFAQSSTYRNLQVLEHAGVLHRMVTNDDSARYELAEDLTEHHHHLICEACGSVRDVALGARLERLIDDGLESIASQHGFATTRHVIDVYGRCASCHS